MSLDELVRIARAFAGLGVEKIRLTGGEPLLRGDVPELVRALKHGLRVPDVALTTNGWLLEKYAASLRAAGLDRVNVSVDSINDETAGRMNGMGFPVARVLRGIDVAATLGLPVKINTVVQRGVNDHEILSIAGYFRERGHPVRFIEFMDVGNTNAWRRDQVVPAKEIIERIGAVWPLVAAGPAYRGEVATRYRYADGSGEIGLIGSVTEPFCKDCNRARLSADGKLFTCLFAAAGHDVLGVIRAGADEVALGRYLEGVWTRRTDRYSDERAGLLAKGAGGQKPEMNYLGG